MNKNKQPKVLLLDIETSPITGYTWGTYQQNVLQILENVKVISIAWQWLGDPAVACIALPDFPGYKPGRVDDKKLVKFIWDLLDQADIIIAHHGDSFDLKILNARFARYSLNAPSFYKTVDTRAVAKKYFRFDSNKLNELGTYLGEGQKINTGGFGLWVRCMAGETRAWDKMKKYNIQDVVLLERIYLRLRPFMTGHPNLNILADKHELSCPVCLSDKVVRRGIAITTAGQKQRFQCKDCGSWSSGPLRKANITLR